MGEAVRIERTGAQHILNSKSMFNRSGLPRVIAKDTEEPTNLGDMLEMEPREMMEDKEPVQKKMSKTKMRLES